MRQNTSILIVDDDAHLRKTLGDIFEGKGYQPIPCSTGKEALDTLKQSVPSLALIDLRLKDISGLELLRKIKDRSPETECIILTGYASQKSAIKAVNLGAYSYLKKPYDIDELLVTLQRAAEKRETKRALQWSEERFRTLVENANDIIYTHDLEGNFTSVNPAATRTFGYSQKEIIKMNITQVVDPKYLPLARERIQDKLKGAPVTAPYELLTYSKKGRPIWVEVSTRLLEREDRPLGVQGIARDITERKKIEEALRESEAKYSALVERSKDGIIIIQDAVFQFINSAFTELVGYTREEMIGADFLKFAVPRYRELVLKRYADRLAGKQVPSIYEIELLRKDGTTLAVELNAARITFQGAPADLAFVRDITQRKRAEEEKEKLQAQLLQAQKMESIGILAGGIAHNFNNILTVIQGFTDLSLMQVEESNPLCRNLKQICTSVSRAADLTQQLLTFSRQHPISVTSLNLSRTIKNLIKMLSNA